MIHNRNQYINICIIVKAVIDKSINFYKLVDFAFVYKRVFILILYIK